MKTIEFCNSFINIANKQGNTFAKNFSKPDMQSRLIVKNFGPIKEVDLDLRNVNVFIGPQASGKSTLAKLFTIFKAPRKFFKEFDGNSETEIENNKKVFLDVLEEYNIRTFLRVDSQIFFDSELHTIKYNDGIIEYSPKLYRQIKDLELLSTEFADNRDIIITKLAEICKKFFLLWVRIYAHLKGESQSIADRRLIFEQNLTEINLIQIIEFIKEIDEILSVSAALYIPAERTFINIVKNSSFNLLKNNVPIPKHILSFGAELEKINLKEINLDFLTEGVAYRNIDGEDRIFINGDNSIKLTEAASGIQSVIPILLPISGRKLEDYHRSFVIEEPELNIFPIAQYKLIQNLESRRLDSMWEDWGTIHTYTTHSPYMLSALNNLLYANKVKTAKLNSNFSNYNDVDILVKKIVKADIPASSFTAYQIKGGVAESIFDRENGLIIDNFIDESSDEINEDFEALMELAKNDAATN